MISYILISYLIMFIWMGIAAFRFPVDTKEFIKMFILAPLSMPTLAIISVVRW